SNKLKKNHAVHKILKKLGAELPDHFVKTNDKWVKSGKEIIKKGKTTLPTGNKTNLVSKHYVCTDCHNTVIEDPDLTSPSPEKRLKYAMKNDLPFLQGTTLYGVVNRESWFNDDYVKKYGKMARKANDDLKKAIQLCARECSQGRKLTKNEMKAILHYLNTISLKIADLNLNKREMKKINSALNKQNADQKTVELIKSKYLKKSPANFIEPMNKEKRKYGKKGDQQKGKFIYENSCLHCHAPGKSTRFELDNSQLTFRFLEKKLHKNSKYNLYKVIRKGTQPLKGYRPYMPHYTKNRMSREQTSHLIAYIKKKVENSTIINCF
ncbi:MAG: cytochrome c, partial [Flavobacteriales bacterium]